LHKPVAIRDATAIGLCNSTTYFLWSHCHCCTKDRLRNGSAEKSLQVHGS